mmetsp:Transcript_32199/g.95708  ORF Transcript_32199/g.95708 Transcript_32199/m.95708 type:complete len:250 (+) Transcript_32199:284-1033(+)
MWKNALPLLRASPTLRSSSECSFLARSSAASAAVTRSAYSAFCSAGDCSTDFATMVSTARVRTGSRVTVCRHTGHSNFFCRSHVSTHDQQNVWEQSIVAACTSQSWQMLHASSEARSVTLSADLWLACCRRWSASCLACSRAASSSLCSSAIFVRWSAERISSAGIASGAACGTSAAGAWKTNSNSGGDIFLPKVMTSPCRSRWPGPSLLTAVPFTRMPFRDLLSLTTHESGCSRSTRPWVREIICGAL